MKTLYKVVHNTHWSMSTNADSYVFRANRAAESKGVQHDKNIVKEELDKICNKNRQAFYGISIIEIKSN